ncbi:hypothetical protein Tco_1405061 [Tanacetum coccineum]
MKSSRIIKKRKIQKSVDELNTFLKIVDFEGDSIQNVEVMEQHSLISRFSVIQSPKGEYIVVQRANRHIRAFNTLNEVLHILDIQDLHHLHRLVIEYYQHIPPTGLGLILLGDLTTMMETTEESDDQLWIMRIKLDPRDNANGGICNFTGRIKGMHVFIGNFTYVVDFMIVEDISSILDPRLSQMVLGKPFIEISNMTHDPHKGAIRFIRGTDEVAYKMPHKIEQHNSLSDLEKEHTKSVYLRNKEDKRRGVEYVIKPGDGVTYHTRRRHTSSSDGITHLKMASACTDSNADLEDSFYDGVTAKMRHAYDSKCDELNTAKVSIMANLSHYGSDALSESVEIDHLKQALLEYLKEKESLLQMVTLLKNDFKKEESRNLDREIALEKQIKHLDNIVFC